MTSTSPNLFGPVATVVDGHTYTVDTRYILTDSKIKGTGTYGVVATAFDSVRNISLAIKRIRPYANDEWDARHTLREIRLLKLLGAHPNVITLFELSLYETKTELYMAMELMDCDLHRVIQSKQPLTEKHHKCFLYQILEGVKAMHSVGVYHRDLKPGNILVSKDCQLRIADFGLARYIDETTRVGKNDQNPMTEYVVTRWYRPPELLISPKNKPYSEAVDLWSVGCILAELIRRKPLFPGKSYTEQVTLIFEVFGFTSADDLGFPISQEAVFFLNKKCKFKKQPLINVVPGASNQALEMLNSLLCMNPEKRATAKQALQFPYLSDAEVLYDYDEISLVKPSPDYFDFEKEKYAAGELKQMIKHEVLISAADAYHYDNMASKSGDTGDSTMNTASGISPSSVAESEVLSPSLNQALPMQQQHEKNQVPQYSNNNKSDRDLTKTQAEPTVARHNRQVDTSKYRRLSSTNVENSHENGPASQLHTHNNAKNENSLPVILKDNPFRSKSNSAVNLTEREQQQSQAITSLSKKKSGIVEEMNNSIQHTGSTDSDCLSGLREVENSVSTITANANANKKILRSPAPSFTETVVALARMEVQPQNKSNYGEFSDVNNEQYKKRNLPNKTTSKQSQSSSFFTKQTSNYNVDNLIENSKSITNKSILSSNLEQGEDLTLVEDGFTQAFHSSSNLILEQQQNNHNNSLNSSGPMNKSSSNTSVMSSQSAPNTGLSNRINSFLPTNLMQSFQRKNVLPAISKTNSGDIESGYDANNDNNRKSYQAKTKIDSNNNIKNNRSYGNMNNNSNNNMTNKRQTDVTNSISRRSVVS
eukprot:gene8497-11488_t